MQAIFQEKTTGEKVIRLKFSEAREILDFQKELQKLVNECRADMTSQLAAYILSQLLRKRNIFFAFPRPNSTLTIDRETSLAFYFLAQTSEEIEYNTTKAKNVIHQHLIA
jgi:hypothetical protein